MGYTQIMNTNHILTTAPSKQSCARTTAGKKQRILFFLAGTFTVIGTILAASLNIWFALIPLVVGANQLFMSALGWCPMSRLLDRILRTTNS